ncbi:MAG: hypothetical protein EOO41_01250 [Methanobacteriota archaeon]|nr:MAG: hypothetical protein EOO41_01250 [Euryarchaeota archaeon]
MGCRRLATTRNAGGGHDVGMTAACMAASWQSSRSGNELPLVQGGKLLSTLVVEGGEEKADGGCVGAVSMTRAVWKRACHTRAPLCAPL